MVGLKKTCGVLLVVAAWGRAIIPVDQCITLINQSVLSNPTKATCQPTVIQAPIDGTILFATPLPSHGIYYPRAGAYYQADPTHQKVMVGKAKLAQRFTPYTDAWYTHGGRNTQELNDLVDAVIDYVKPKLSIATKKPKLAIFDIDETIVSFYWVHRANHCKQRGQHAGLVVLEPLHRLYQFFQAHKCAIAFITARKEPRRKATESMLKACGYQNYAALHLLPVDYDEAKVHVYKESARQTLSQQYEIVATIDDDCKNLTGKALGWCAVWVPSLLYRRDHDEAFFSSLQKIVTTDVYAPTHKHAKLVNPE